jgi:hypothetical protein
MPTMPGVSLSPGSDEEWWITLLLLSTFTNDAACRPCAQTYNALESCTALCYMCSSASSSLATRSSMSLLLIINSEYCRQPWSWRESPFDPQADLPKQKPTAISHCCPVNLAALANIACALQRDK